MFLLGKNVWPTPTHQWYAIPMPESDFKDSQGLWNWNWIEAKTTGRKFSQNPSKLVVEWNWNRNWIEHHWAGIGIESESNQNRLLLELHIIAIHLRPVQFARPTSGTMQFYLRTSPFASEQVPRACLVISQLLVDPQQSMTYQFVSTFNKESIPLVHIIFLS